ncbi:N-acetyltransferase family protein [Nitrobacteraceae bacterium UC4449_H16]
MLRPITTDDVGPIIDMVLTLHVESPNYSLVKPDVPYVRTTLTSMIEQPCFIGTIDVDRRGFMFGIASRTWYDSELNACELLLYILPKYRGGLLAPRLIKNFETVAKGLDCIHVRAGTSTRVNTEQTLRLYERLGYTRDGHTVTKRIN